MNEKWRDRLPTALGLGSPCLAAAVTATAVVIDIAVGSGAGELAGLAVGLNAALAGLGSATGGFLRQDELAFRILYVIPSGIGGVMLYVLILACPGFLLGSSV